MSQTNSIDSTTISKVVRLINDYKSCKEYTDSLEVRLKECDVIVDRLKIERNNYNEIIKEYDSMVEEINARNNTLERKLKRTRRIGIFGTIGGFIVGVILIILI
jgi:DNA repair exonuclease SbcCD ATPase subunit